MSETKTEVEAMIFDMAAAILLGKATEDDIKKVVNLAKEHDLLPLVRQEVCNIGCAFEALKGSNG